MSSKKTEKDNADTTPSEEVVTDKTNEDKKKKNKKNKKTESKPKKENNNELYTIVDLVTMFKYDTDIDIQTILINEGYYKRYTRELELINQGYEIKPSIRINEFKKLIKK